MDDPPYPASLASSPERVQQTVRIGTVLAAVSAAALGATTLAEDLAPHLADAGLSEPGATAAAVALVSVVVGYLALVLAELVPYRFAAHRAEWYALALAPGLNRFAVLVAPLRALLTLTAGRRVVPTAGSRRPSTRRSAPRNCGRSPAATPRSRSTSGG